MKNTIEIAIYNAQHVLVNRMLITAAAKDVPQLIKMNDISARKRHQYVISSIVK